MTWYATAAVDAYAPTLDRVVATAAALIALAGVIIGVLALIRRRAPLAALLTGAAGLLIGVVVVATADGGPGTGNGIVGGYAAIVLGVIALALGGATRWRSRRAG